MSETTRVVLYDQNMPCYLWAKACSITMYIQNKVPHKVLCKMTIEEAFTRKKPDVSHFRIFGSLTHYHIRGDTCYKLDQTTERRYLWGTERPQRNIRYLF